MAPPIQKPLAVLEARALLSIPRLPSLNVILSKLLRYGSYCSSMGGGFKGSVGSGYGMDSGYNGVYGRLSAASATMAEAEWRAATEVTSDERSMLRIQSGPPCCLEPSRDSAPRAALILMLPTYWSPLFPSSISFPSSSTCHPSGGCAVSGGSGAATAT